MNFVKLALGVSILALSACATFGGKTEAPAVAREATVVDSLVGKRLVTGSDAVIMFNADGTMGGTMRGEPVAGAYDADAARVCSTYTSPAILVGREFCSTPVIDGNTVVFNRADGSQSPVYTIEG